MASSAPPPGNPPPRKPWEQAGSSSGPSPFKPPSSGGTSDVVEASGTAKPGEIVSTTERATDQNRNALVRPPPSRPWEQSFGQSYGGYRSNMGYNSGYGTGMYSSHGGFGGSYGSGLYGKGMNGVYGAPYGRPGMYGGSMYSSIGGPMGGYGTGGPYGNQDPNNPYGPPPSPPGFWMSFLRVLHGVVDFFGRISMLVDQNTQAFHFFMSALLQLFDRSGVLYGELARFIFRILGIRTKLGKQHNMGPGQQLPGPDAQGQHFNEGPKGTSGGEWNNLWGDGDKRNS